MVLRLGGNMKTVVFVAWVPRPHGLVLVTPLSFFLPPLGCLLKDPPTSFHARGTPTLNCVQTILSAFMLVHHALVVFDSDGEESRATHHQQKLNFESIT